MRKERKENYMRCFGVSEVPPTSSSEIMTMEKFKQLPLEIQKSFIESKII